jgi:putative nucleotidyltransferase with HDIG domain
MTLGAMANARILIVDDAAYVRMMMAEMLLHAGYDVVTANGSEEALIQVAENAPFDLVLSDIMMGGMDGTALLGQLQREHPNLPVVMVTAVHDITVAMGTIRQGAYDYLLKPFERDQLLACVTRALEYRELTMQNLHYKEMLEKLVAARTVMLRQTLRDLERSYDITLEALGDALDLRDEETEGHSKRVTAYTMALARAAGIIVRGAYLHDMGKIATPDSILLKPGKLDAEEIAIMQKHCAYGYHMLRKIPYLRKASEIVYSHQERFDGSGYPRGLKGDKIPLGSRIFAIADTMDAITSDRPYRKARSFEEAREEIIRCAGTQFDPEMVEVYKKIPIQLWEELRREIMQHAGQTAIIEGKMAVPNRKSA